MGDTDDQIGPAESSPPSPDGANTVDPVQTAATALDKTTVQAVLASLAEGVPGAATEAIRAQDGIEPELADQLQEILESDRSASLMATAIGDLLRARGEDRLPTSNEFYRAAFYLGEDWAGLSSNPLFAWFCANKAGQPMDKWIHYFDVYQRILEKYVGKEIRVLEIGVFHGGGLDLLRTFLGESAKLVGLDCDPSAKAACRGRFDVMVGDQSDREFLQQVNLEHGPFDVIIDDGGHTMNQQISSITSLFPLLRDGGTYVVEDTHTSYWPEYQDTPLTFMEWAKQRIDDLNGYHHSQERDLPIWTTDVSTIGFFDSITVFEKRRRFAPFAEVTGTGSALQNNRIDESTLLNYRAAANLRGAELARMGASWAQERKELQAQGADLQAHLVEIRTSRSWRLTSPLRRWSRKMKS